jgi:DNA-binding response OmpR family regulator
MRIVSSPILCTAPLGSAWGAPEEIARGERADRGIPPLAPTLDRSMGQPPSVLVVEDDPGIAEAVLYALERDGMRPIWAATLDAAGPELPGSNAVVLDLGLPDGSGFSLLRAAVSLPVPPRVIVVTSRTEDTDCIAALEAGADDFVTKPFSPRALVARLRATLRRGAPDAASTQPTPGVSRCGALLLDAARREASFGGLALPLTKIEMDLLSVLAGAPGRVHTRDQLVERVWGGEYALTSRTVDSHVKALRKKLDAAGAPAGLIETVRSVGFKLRDAA